MKQREGRAPEAVLWEGGLLSGAGSGESEGPAPHAGPFPPHPSPFPHLRPPVPRWGPPCGNCPWRRGQASRPWASSDREGCGGSAALAAPNLSRFPEPRPPAPLCGRGPAGSVAAEGGAGMLKEAGAIASTVSLLYSWGLGPVAPLGHLSSITLRCITSGTRPTADLGAQDPSSCPD